MLGCENAVKFYRTSAVEYLFGGRRRPTTERPGRRRFIPADSCIEPAPHLRYTLVFANEGGNAAMPTLDWIGKKAVVNHHREVPYHLLKCDKTLSVGDPGSGN
jgi:hypothetical protein